MVHNYSRAIVILGLLLAILLMPIVVYAAEQEVSMPASGLDTLGSAGVWCRLGQRLHINGTVFKIGYRVGRVGNPSGNITFSIYDTATDEVLFSGVWGDASLLNTVETSGYQYIAVNPPLELNRDVRLCVEYYGGNETDYCKAGYYSGDRITGQSYTNYMCYGQWHDIGEAEEGSYYLSYIPADAPPSDVDTQSSPPFLAFGIGGAIGASLAGFGYVYVKKRNKRKV